MACSVNETVATKFDLDRRIAAFPAKWHAPLRANVERVFNVLTGGATSHDPRLDDLARQTCAAYIDSESARLRVATLAKAVRELRAEIDDG